MIKTVLDRRLLLAFFSLFPQVLLATGVVYFFTGQNSESPLEMGWTLRWTYESTIGDELASSLAYREGITTLENMGFSDIRSRRTFWSLDGRAIHVIVISGQDMNTGQVYLTAGASFESRELALEDAREMAWATWPFGTVYSQGYFEERYILITQDGSSAIDGISSTVNGPGGGGGGSGGGSGGPPYIITDLADIYLEQGGSGSFVIAAGGTSPLSYTWYVGANAPKVSSKGSYTIGYADLWMDGTSARVEISNQEGRISSRTATLHVTERTPNYASIAGVYVDEGPSGLNSVNIEVSLSRPAENTVYIDYSTADSTARAYQDYESATGTLVIARGQSGGAIPIGVYGNDYIDGDRSFYLYLDRAVNAQIASATSRITIEDDDSTTRSFGTFDPNFSYDWVYPNRVSDMAVASDNSLYVGGSFSSIGGVSRTSVARLRVDNAIDQSFDPVLENSEGTLGSVTDIELADDGSVFLYGDITWLNGSSGVPGIPPDYSMEYHNFVRVDTNGDKTAGWRNTSSSFGLDPNLERLRYYPGQNLVTVYWGEYDATTAESRPGGVLKGLPPSYDAGILSQRLNTKWHLPGDFLLVGTYGLEWGQGYNELLRFGPPVFINSIQTYWRYLDESFKSDPPLDAYGSWYSVIKIVDVDDMGRILMYVEFTDIDGKWRRGLHRVLSTGKHDYSFTFVELTSAPGIFEIQPDGKILVVGNTETAVNGTGFQHLVRIDASGNVDPTFKFKDTLPPGSYISQIESASNDFAYILLGDSQWNSYVRRVITGPVAAPDLDYDLQDLTQMLGQRVAFVAAETGQAPFQYEWYLDGAKQAETGPLFEFYPTDPAFVGEHSVKVVVRNAFGSVASRLARLRVVSPDQIPVITSQPEALTIYAGEVPRFGVEANSPSRLRYQWYYDFQPLEGENGPFLLGGIDTSTANGGRAVFVDVINDYWTVRSDYVLLRIEEFEDYSTWRYKVFAPFFAGSVLADPDFDFNNDGLTNFHAFVMGVSPAETGGIARNSTKLIQQDDTHDYVRFIRSATASYLVVAYERSTNLHDWEPVSGDVVETRYDEGSILETIKFIRGTPSVGPIHYRATYRIDN